MLGPIAGFNEAAPLRKRKGYPRRSPARPAPSFNEAAPLRKRKVLGGDWPSRQDPASMRPLPYGSGKAEFPGRIEAVELLQ